MNINNLNIYKILQKNKMCCGASRFELFSFAAAAGQRNQFKSIIIMPDFLLVSYLACFCWNLATIELV